MRWTNLSWSYLCQIPVWSPSSPPHRICSSSSQPVSDKLTAISKSWGIQPVIFLLHPRNIHIQKHQWPSSRFKLQTLSRDKKRGFKKRRVMLYWETLLKFWTLQKDASEFDWLIPWIGEDPPVPCTHQRMPCFRDACKRRALQKECSLHWKLCLRPVFQSCWTAPLDIFLAFQQPVWEVRKSVFWCAKVQWKTCRGTADLPELELEGLASLSAQGNQNNLLVQTHLQRKEPATIHQLQAWITQ